MGNTFGRVLALAAIEKPLARYGAMWLPERAFSLHLGCLIENVVYTRKKIAY
jgi:hypothetical protein